jgi:RHS repeat-associated protein
MSYAYDALGRRTSKAVQGGTPTQYLYDGANAVQEAVGSTINPILAGLNIDERFARNDVSGRVYFLTDALNSTIALTSTTGAIQNMYSYDPYGNVSQSGAGFTNPYQYTGREADTADLYYYRALYYSPQFPGFISEDPIGFGGGQLSFYAAFSGDPLSRIDPSGLSSLIFNPLTQNLTVVNGNGVALENFPAASNTARASRGPWADGTYEWSAYNPHPGNGPEGEYGENGINIFNVPGCSGCGVHSGRRDVFDGLGRKGIYHATLGCIRTTDEATGFIQQLAASGYPLTGLTVSSSPSPTNLAPFDPSLPGGPKIYPPDP